MIDLISKMDDYLAERFDNDTANRSGIPTVQELSDYLRVSPRYLSDMLKSLTGQSAQQQHMHDCLIEKSKGDTKY